MTARFSVAEREKQKQPKRSRCSGSVFLVQPGWRRAPFSRRHCHEMDGRSAALPQRDAVLYGAARRSGGRAEGEQLSRARRGGALGLLVCPPRSGPRAVLRLHGGRAPRGSELTPRSPAEAQTRWCERASARRSAPSLPSRLSPCVWNERRAAAVSGRSGAARRRSAIREYQPHSGRGGIKPTADQLSASPEGRAEGQNLVVCSSCCCWAAFFFFFFNELTYHERKKWIRGAFISSCDPSFTSLTGDSHSYIHSTCRFGCSELEKLLCMQQTWLASRIQASLKSVSNTYWNPGAIVSSGRVIFSYYALLAE